MITEAYPLQWPVGRPRVARHDRMGDPFQMPSGKIRHELAKELRLMGSDDFIISSNLLVRQDGLPYANQKSPDDPGIALYFNRKGAEICISCDQYSTVDANLRAIGKTVEAIRGIERWGTEEMMDAAFTGFAALPETVITPEYKAWWEVLNVPSDAPRSVTKAAYLHLAQRWHPDKPDGDAVKFNKIKTAYDQAMSVEATK